MGSTLGGLFLEGPAPWVLGGVGRLRALLESRQHPGQSLGRGNGGGNLLSTLSGPCKEPRGGGS